ncbi:MAG: hypothetical protein U0U09_05000 [Cyclobacteriaceae bacterium]
MKKIIFTLLLLICHGANIFSQEKPKPVFYDELLNLAKKSSKETVSSSDRISLVATDIYLTESDATRPDKVLEINCEVSKFDGTKTTYSTVHRQIFKAKEDGFSLDRGFFLFRDISLQGVEKIQLTIGVRSLNEEQSKLFAILSNVVGSAIENVPVIQTMRDLVKTKGQVEEKIPLFNATFYIANSYINFEKIRNEKLKLPYLSPSRGNNIAFESTSKTVPRGILKKLGNLVLGEGTFEDKENIGGVIVINATKETPKPPVKAVMDKLQLVYKTIRTSKIEDLPNVIAQANSTIDIVYSDPADQKSSAYQNASFYMSLIECYYKYLKSSDPKVTSAFFDSFGDWNVDKKSYIIDEDYSSIPVKGIYSLYPEEDQASSRIVDFYAPNNLGNDFITQSLVIQYNMHSDFKLKLEAKEKIKKFTYLTK